LSRTRIFSLLAVVAAVAGGIVFGLLARTGESPSIAGFVYPEPHAISPFRLSTQDGKPFGLDALKGRWTFVYFGYTYCPDVCPTTLAELARAHKLLKDAGLDSANQYVFVSVDPERDTPRRLAEYVGFFDKTFLGATGSDDALAPLARQVGVAYSFPEGRKGKTYAVDHSSIVALFDPDARLHAVFTPPQKAEGIADGFRKILGNRPRFGGSG
jgi:protein SCO1/2